MKLPTNRPVLGQPVTARGRAHRVYGTFKQSWERGDLLPFEGLYVGYRYKREGRTQIDYEEGNTFTPTGTVLVALVLINERQQPIPVMWEDLRWDKYVTVEVPPAFDPNTLIPGDHP